MPARSDDLFIGDRAAEPDRGQGGQGSPLRHALMRGFRPAAPRPPLRAASLLASTGLAALLGSAGLAEAACPGDSPGDHVFAGAGDVCNVSGDYVPEGGGVIAIHAADGGAITWTGDLNLAATSSDDTPAVEGENGGSVTITDGIINTYGNGSPGAIAIGQAGGEGGAGGSVIINGATTIITIGTGSYGLAVNGADSSLTTNGVISEGTSGISVKTIGDDAFGAYNGSGSGFSSGGTMSLTNTTITTFGAGSDGVVTNSGGVTTISGGSVTTSGDDAIGLYASGSGSSITTSNGTAIVTGAPIEGEGGSVTLGARAFGALADSGGQVSLGGGSVTTYGDGAIGLYATGAHSSISASGVAAETFGAQDSESGLYAFGVLAADGGSVSFSGGSVTTNSAVAPGAASVGAGSSVTLNSGAVVTTFGGGSVGLLVNGSGASLTTNGIFVTTYGNIDESTGDAAFGAYNGFTPNGASTGGTMSLTNTTIVTYGASADGVVTNSGGVTTISGGSVTTSGDDALGLYASGAGSSITTLNGTVIVTGAPAGGGGEGDLVAAQQSTSGAYAYGALADNGAHISLAGGSVTTNGFGAAGLISTGEGSLIATNGVAVTTHGDGYAFGALANAGATLTIAGGSITTSGLSAIGVNARDAGTSVSLSGGTAILTTGDGSGGLAVNGGASLTTNGVSVTTHGGVDPNDGFAAVGAFNGGAPLLEIAAGGTMSLTDTTIATTGDNAPGVVTRDGGTTTVASGSVSTSGASANAVDTAGAGSSASFTGTTIAATGAGSKGAALVGTGSSLTLDGVTLSTAGDPDAAGHAALGVYNGSGSDGLFPGGGTATIKDTTISTSGFKAAGVATEDGGTTSITGGSIATSGNGAYAVVSNSGGLTTLSGTSISTTGDGSGGLGVNGAGSEIDATNVTVSTTGGFDSASGLHAYGLYNGPYGDFTSGGVAKLTNSSISTEGAQMYGVFTSIGGVTTVTGGSVSTSGLGAIGVLTDGGGVVNLDGASVATSGQDAHALAVTGAGSQANLSGTNTFATLGYGAVGLYVTKGGVLAAAGPVNVTTSGGVSPATGLGAFGINADGAGSKITLGAATITTSGAGANGLFASDALGSGAAGTIAATGALNITTTNPAAAAVALQGDGAQVLATGGGSIAAAGNAIAFLGGASQTATFDNFTISSISGDIVFADPSTATVNFNNTTATAGAGNLLNSTAGSFVTLNASDSKLTGPIATDAASTSAVNLTNNSLWTMTGSSVVSNLAVTNSAVVFAPPGAGGAFKTLTLGSYVGSGASMTMNTALGGSNSPTDQIIINGGQATGSTLLSINNVGGLGAQTTGNGIPIILAENGGSIAHDAFSLASTPVAGGFRYALSETDQAWYLVSSPTSTVNDIAASLTNVAKSQQQLLITNRVLTSILLGATEQISCSNCSSGFGAIGSYALGAHGRWGLSDNVTVMGGFSYGEYSADNATVSNAPTVAGSLVYDFVNWGRSRPFLEAGVGLTPYSEVSYTRPYFNGDVTSVGHAKAINRNAAIFGRVGWVDRLTPIDEAAVYADISRNWMTTGGYTEATTTGVNPYPATVQQGLDTLNVVRVGAQYTHLFYGKVEGNVSAAVAYGFDGNFGSAVNIFDFGTVSPYPIGNSAWVEYGARIGYRLKDRMVLDAFVVGTFGGEIGSTIHGGLGLRYMF